MSGNQIRLVKIFPLKVEMIRNVTIGHQTKKDMYMHNTWDANINP